MEIKSFTEYISATNNKVTINLDKIRIQNKDIDNISFTSLPEFFIAFEVHIGGLCVFHVDSEDLNKYLNQVKLALTKLPFQQVEFHFVYDPRSLYAIEKYEMVDEIINKYVSNPQFVPDINDITGECLNIDEEKILTQVKTGKQIKKYLPIKVQTPDIVLTLVDGTQLKRFDYEHRLVKMFNPDSNINSSLEITPIDGIPLEVAMKGNMPFKAEYTNYLRYNGGLTGLMYSV